MEKSFNRIDQAIQKTAKAYKGGAKAIAKAIGSNQKTFTNKCNPKSKKHILTISELADIIRHTGDARILQQLSQEFGVVCIKKIDKDNLSDMSVINAWADWDVESADISRAFRNAFIDNQLTEAELDEISIQMYEAFEHELYLFQLLDVHLRGDISCPLLTQLDKQYQYTHYYDALSAIFDIDDTVFQKIIRELGTTEGVIRRKLNNSVTDMDFNIHDLVKIMNITDKISPLVALANNLGYVAVKVLNHFTPEDDEALLELWSDSAAERAWTVQHIQRVIDSENLSEKDMARICKTMFEDFEQGFELLKRLEDFVE